MVTFWTYAGESGTTLITFHASHWHLIIYSKWRLGQGVMKTSYINNILNSQTILIKFVCKSLSFQTHLLLDMRFPLIVVV